MITESEKTTLREKLELYEGLVEHMYLDTKGYVTVGIGHLITNALAAKKLDFVRQKDNKKATEEEIDADYIAVKKQIKGLLSGSYRKHTKLKLKKVSIDSLTNKHIESFEGELKVIYGGENFDAFPVSVRLALFDMIFNLGMTKLNSDFPTFNKYIKSNKWGKAAEQSNRVGISKSRNKYVKDLLESAEEEKEEETVQ